MAQYPLILPQGVRSHAYVDAGQFVQRKTPLQDGELVSFDIAAEKMESYLVTFGSMFGCGLICCTPCCCPITHFCPGKIISFYKMELSNDSLVYYSAIEDTCQITALKQTLPLDKVHDATVDEVEPPCCFCFCCCCEYGNGLKTLYVQSSRPRRGVNLVTGADSIATVALVDPDMAREAILLASKQYKELHAPAASIGMNRGGGDLVTDRLNRMNQLVYAGLLTPGEAAKYKTALLTSQLDETGRLQEILSLQSKGLLNPGELEDMKAKILNQL